MFHISTSDFVAFHQRECPLQNEPSPPSYMLLIDRKGQEKSFSSYIHIHPRTKDAENKNLNKMSKGFTFPANR